MIFGKPRPETPPFAVLFRAHAPFAWRVLRRYGVREADLEDTCQEVFMVVHRRIADFEGRAHVRTWIYEIARRVALAHRRKAAVRCEQPSDAPEEESAAEDAALAPDAQLDDKRALAWLEQALASLSEPKREAFILYELEEMTLAEVAEALGCALNTAHYRVTSARDELRAFGKRVELRGRAASAREVLQ